MSLSSLNTVPFFPTGILASGHAQTMYAGVFHQPPDVPADREDLITVAPDTRVLCLFNQAGPAPSPTTVLLLHGLEGSAQSGYIVSVAQKLLKAGIDVIRMNMRSCGGRPWLSPTLYHAGLTADLRQVISHYAPTCPRLFVAGFSLGANTVLKFAGEGDLSSAVTGVIATSPPFDLAACSQAIIQPQNKVYDHYYLSRMQQTYRTKRRFFPERYPMQALTSVRNLMQFDQRITAPHGGFRDAADYYQQNSCGQFLPHIAVPTLIIHALDDPIIPARSVKAALAHKSQAVETLITPHGGHVGFLNSPAAAEGDLDSWWAENRLIDWVISRD